MTLITLVISSWKVVWEWMSTYVYKLGQLIGRIHGWLVKQLINTYICNKWQIDKATSSSLKHISHNKTKGFQVPNTRRPVVHGQEDFPVPTAIPQSQVIVSYCFTFSRNLHFTKQKQSFTQKIYHQNDSFSSKIVFKYINSVYINSLILLSSTFRFHSRHQVVNICGNWHKQGQCNQTLTCGKRGEIENKIPQHMLYCEKQQ